MSLVYEPLYDMNKWITNIQDMNLPLVKKSNYLEHFETIIT
jgi:hypothetical protein